MLNTNIGWLLDFHLSYGWFNMWWLWVHNHVELLPKQHWYFMTLAVNFQLILFYNSQSSITWNPFQFIQIYRERFLVNITGTPLTRTGYKMIRANPSRVPRWLFCNSNQENMKTREECMYSGWNIWILKTRFTIAAEADARTEAYPQVERQKERDVPFFVASFASVVFLSLMSKCSPK